MALSPARACEYPAVFILSGYVIGLTNNKRLNRQSIGPYLRKRFVRLYPIYFITLIIIIWPIAHHYSWPTIIGNFLFLQNSVVPVIYEVNPIWSLNNEAVYYLLFIPISYFGLSPGRVGFAAALLGTLCSLLLNQPLLGAYSFGFAFWLSGLWLAQNRPFPERQSSRWQLVGLLFLFLGHPFLNLFDKVQPLIEHALGRTFLFPDGPTVTFGDLLQLPFCFYLFLRFTNHTFKHAGLWLWWFIGSALFYYGSTVFEFGVGSDEALFLLLPTLFTLIGAVVLSVESVLHEPGGTAVLSEWMLKLGAISYGVYIIHFPISVVLYHIRFFSGTPLTFGVRLLLDVGLTLFAGAILELRFQPWARNLLNPPKDKK